MTTAAPTAPKTKQTTEYIVLREASSAHLPGLEVDVTSFTATLAIVGNFKASSANEAIKRAAGDQPGVYHAVPARSFKPVKVTVHTETTIKLG